MHWLKQAFRRSFDYDGRSRRMEYWSYALFAVITYSLIIWAERSLGFGDEKQGPIRPIVALLLIIPGLAVSVRRLHDSGYVGWWVVLPFVPILQWIVALAGEFDTDVHFRITKIAMLLAPLVLLALMCLPGTFGPNRFGPDPRDEAQADDDV